MTDPRAPMDSKSTAAYLAPAVPIDGAKSGDSTVPTAAAPAEYPDPATEIGGPTGPEPTRYGDWERKGIAVDF